MNSPSRYLVSHRSAAAELRYDDSQAGFPETAGPLGGLFVPASYIHLPPRYSPMPSSGS
jgi:hypothetical protein